MSLWELTFKYNLPETDIQDVINTRSALNTWALLRSPILPCWKTYLHRSWLPSFPLSQLFVFAGAGKCAPSIFCLNKVRASYLPCCHLLTVFCIDLCWVSKRESNSNLFFMLKCQQCCLQQSTALLNLPSYISIAQWDTWVFCYTSHLWLVSQSASREPSMSWWLLSQVFG